MNKHDRQKLILQIIKNMDISTQFELVNELRKKGLDAKQATVSRDIKNLKLVKQIGTKGSFYRISSSTSNESNKGQQLLNDIFINTVIKIDDVDNLIVLHTRPGGAPNLAFYLDEEKIEGIIGTIAGDDTILIIVNTKIISKDLLINWREWLI